MLRDLATKYKIYVFLALLTFFSYLPLGFGLISIKPAIIVISVFYFSIISQTRPSIPFLIILGLFDDLIGNSVVGITSLNYVLTSMIASSNTKALLEQKFTVVWAALLMALVVVNIVEVMVLTYMHSVQIIKFEIAFKIALSLLVYPVLHYFYSLKLNWFRVR